jgi:hypothetical protein
MPSYLVETYLPANRADDLSAGDRRAERAARALTRSEAPVRFDCSIHVPEDEICFFVFEAPSNRAAALAAERAELDAIRVVEAVSSLGKEQR